MNLYESLILLIPMLFALWVMHADIFNNNEGENHVMSLQKFSAIVPDVMAEITRLIEAKGKASVRKSVREDVQACKAGDLVAENQPVDPRMHVGRARRVRGGRQLELQLEQTIRRN